VRYMLETGGDPPQQEGLTERPTHEDIKGRGEGEYTLRRDDGTVIKHFRVSTNRNGNLKVEALSPDGLEGISTLNLHRMIKDYRRIVKLWPGSASARDYRKVVSAVEDRFNMITEMEQDQTKANKRSAAARKAVATKRVNAEQLALVLE
jgi:hypothetical protein